MKRIKNEHLPLPLPVTGRRWLLLKFLFSLVILLSGLGVFAQEKSIVRGTVVDSRNEPVIGAAVVFKNTPSLGTITDVNGQFNLAVDAGNSILVISFLGMESQTIDINGKSTVRIVMVEDSKIFEEVVVVGYGKQKKESIIGAISQTDGKVLQRAGGVSSIGAALTGNVSGVVTSASTGMPGEEDPKIVIRAASTWNNTDPLVLVDGVERPMNSVDISAVESISVLKDASATAVFGVKGGNGVIIITTKRGKEGKALVKAGFNSTMKVPSKLPGKYDSYGALKVRNDVIEYELGASPSSWNDYLPEEILDKYRNPSSVEEAERYPNVDWADVLFKDYAMSYNGNLSVSGGTNFVKYFSSVDFLNEGDLMEQHSNNRGYDPGYSYNRLNVRSNLDFKLSPTTEFKVNLAGSYAVKKNPWGATGNEYGMWIAAYTNASDVFVPQYSDGTWAYYAKNEGTAGNSVRTLAIGGVQYRTTTVLNTDFTLTQDLSKWVKGLSLTGTLTFDNTFVEKDRGVNDLYNDTQVKWIDPDTGLESYKLSYDANSRFDFQEGVKWTPAAGTVDNTLTKRRLYYLLQSNYVTTIADRHDVTLMGLFSREELATGIETPRYREDWVFRTTYAFDKKYMVEYNGAYNGSEMFGPGYRFDYFSSGGIGWIISEEPFIQNLGFVNNLKLRASYGEIGDDRVLSDIRFLYDTQWAYGGKSRLGVTGEAAEQSPYTWYKESSVGNPQIRWETIYKKNAGLDFAFFKSLVSGSIDLFSDHRVDILTNARAIPSYYGATAPYANLGDVETNGYEIELKFNKTLGNGLRLWANTSLTHATSKVLFADDPQMLPDYQKKEGKALNQAYATVSQGFYNNWDEMYGSTQHNTNDKYRLPGSYNLVDYNADGVIDNFDNIPYGYSGTPQNTYNATIGFEWKGFSGFVQFYGVNNVTRQVVFNSLSSQNHVVYEEGSYWSKDNFDADSPMPRWLTTPAGYYSGSRYMFDGSYLRLKNAEVAYTFDRNHKWIQKMGLDNVRLYVNGNNLWVWTDMPDDRESNFAGTGWASQGAYPTVKRFNMGLNISF